MIIMHLARIAGREGTSVDVVDVGFDAGFLAAVNGDVDVAAVGLTQLTEAERRGASTVLNMDQLGFADITGFITKRSTLEARRKDIHNLISMWFDSVEYVLSDVERNANIVWNKAGGDSLHHGNLCARLITGIFSADCGRGAINITDETGMYGAKKIYGIMTDFCCRLVS